MPQARPNIQTIKLSQSQNSCFEELLCNWLIENENNAWSSYIWDSFDPEINAINYCIKLNKTLQQ